MQGGGGQGRRRQWCHPRQKFANIYGKGKKLQAGASGRERNRAILEKHVSSTYMCHGIPRNCSLDCKLPTLGVPACPPQSHVIVFYGFFPSLSTTWTFRDRNCKSSSPSVQSTYNVSNSMSRGCTFYGLLNVCLNMVCLSET